MQHAYRWNDDNEEAGVVIVGPMTAAEYFARIVEGPRETRKAELIDGALILFSTPLDVHERLAVFLLRLIGEYAERFDLGEVRGSRSAVKLAEDQVYQPDVLFVSRDRMSLFERQGIFGPPDLVIEVLSRSTAGYDRSAKLLTYDHTGVREVWLIDPTGPQRTEILQRQGLRLQPVVPGPDGRVASIALPGFRLHLAWLWPEDRFIPVREAIDSMLR
jgi:Uma2 family endonuclease